MRDVTNTWVHMLMLLLLMSGKYRLRQQEFDYTCYYYITVLEEDCDGGMERSDRSILSLCFLRTGVVSREKKKKHENSEKND